MSEDEFFFKTVNSNTDNQSDQVDKRDISFYTPPPPPSSSDRRDQNDDEA